MPTGLTVNNVAVTEASVSEKGQVTANKRDWQTSKNNNGKSNDLESFSMHGLMR